jgi:transposase InsO family protein
MVPDPKAAPDLVERRFEAEAPNRLWLADLTYVPTSEGYLLLGIVMDMLSRKIVGWSMRDNLEAELVVDALAMVVNRRRPPAGLVHHSVRRPHHCRVRLLDERCADPTSSPKEESAVSCMPHPQGAVFGGIDTHKDLHLAALVAASRP